MMTTATTPSASEVSARIKANRQRLSIWAGRVLSALPVLMLVFSGSLKLAHAPAFEKAAIEHLGMNPSSITPIGLLELACVALYVFPRTAVLGAILVTAYLGGAVATHVRVGDPFMIPVVLGVLVWVGLYLRDERIRELTPLRSAVAPR